MPPPVIFYEVRYRWGLRYYICNYPTKADPHGIFADTELHGWYLVEIRPLWWFKPFWNAYCVGVIIKDAIRSRLARLLHRHNIKE